ncbi:MAG TPA: hypothetical protein VGB10_05260 [Bacteroidota bacterium]
MSVLLVPTQSLPALPTGRQAVGRAGRSPRLFGVALTLGGTPSR